MNELQEISLNPQINFEKVSEDNESVEYIVKSNIDDIEQQIAELETKMQAIDTQIDKSMCKADMVDYIIAASSGLITGLVDIFVTREFSFERGKQWSDEKVESFIKKLAKRDVKGVDGQVIKGYIGDDLNGAIRHLEKFHLASDSVTSQFGGGKQHHLRDFAHHFSPIGLFFSLLTQFTKRAYGTSNNGTFKIVKIAEEGLIGKTVPQKIILGVIYWFFHMASDMAGTSQTAGGGTGIPGPIVSMIKEMSTLPIFKNKDNTNKISETTSKLFNGTLFATKDENDKILKDINGNPMIRKLDLRGELAVAHEVIRQATPIVINEAIVRALYFIRRLLMELKKHNSIREIEWKNVIPFNNRTIARMITVSSGVFTVVDATGAIIKSGGINANTLLHLNFVGIGRFAIAGITDIVMTVKGETNITHLHIEKMTMGTLKNQFETQKTLVMLDEAIIQAKYIDRHIVENKDSFDIINENRQENNSTSFDELDLLMKEFKKHNK